MTDHIHREIRLSRGEMITGETEAEREIEIMTEEEGAHLDGMIEIDGDHHQDTEAPVENEEECEGHRREQYPGRLRDTTETETGPYSRSPSPRRSPRRYSPSPPPRRYAVPHFHLLHAHLNVYETGLNHGTRVIVILVLPHAIEIAVVQDLRQKDRSVTIRIHLGMREKYPSPGKNVVENDVKPKSPPPEVPVSASVPPHTLPLTSPIPPKQPIRSSSPPKHPRNWSESRPTESSLFIPPSIRRGRGRGGGSYRGGMYRGGGPPDAPRAPRNRGIPQASPGQEHPQETTAIFSGADSAPSPPASTKSKTETPPRPPSAEPEETIEQLLKWVNEELIVTDMMQEERKIMDRSKVLRDEYLAAHKYTHELAMEHYKISNETHQALHEYEMANIELKHLQQRRQGLNKQQELARLGLLGMDYESDSIGTPV
ncbi:hypothetical protein F5050DRAFT_1711223 [Lentinula boryana]|uniref:Uncharacterized protein n=1 Tax=Lentinula boryana TaxID=40481 RepID=A0ABQ8QG68_9AGAR|nr:hypothetical protein F5050DRAFT_1711223 [Lentinula boryana]